MRPPKKITKYLLGLVESHYIEAPTFQELEYLLERKTIYTYKCDQPYMTSKVRSVSPQYIVSDGIWPIGFFTGVFYLKWFWQKK